MPGDCHAQWFDIPVQSPEKSCHARVLKTEINNTHHFSKALPFHVFSKQSGSAHVSWSFSKLEAIHRLLSFSSASWELQTCRWRDMPPHKASQDIASPTASTFPPQDAPGYSVTRWDVAAHVDDFLATMRSMRMLWECCTVCCHTLPWATRSELQIFAQVEPAETLSASSRELTGEINGAVQNSKANKRRRDAIVTRQMSILKCPFSNHRDATIPQANNRGTSSAIRRLLWLRCFVAQWYSSCMMLMPTAALEAESSHVESFFPRFQSRKSPKWSTTMHRKGIDRSKGCRHLFWV